MVNAGPLQTAIQPPQLLSVFQAVVLALPAQATLNVQLHIRPNLYANRQGNVLAVRLILNAKQFGQQPLIVTQAHVSSA